jgi:hypothetical protein
MSIIKLILKIALVIALVCGCAAAIVKLNEMKDNITVDKVISGVVDGATNVGDSIIDWVNGGSSDSSNSSGDDIEEDITFSDNAISFYKRVTSLTSVGFNSQVIGGPVAAAQNVYENLSNEEKANQEIYVTNNALTLMIVGYNNFISTCNSGTGNANDYIYIMNDAQSEALTQLQRCTTLYAQAYPDTVAE